MKCVGNVLASANERSQLCHTTQIESSQKFGFFFFLSLSYSDSNALCTTAILYDSNNPWHLSVCHI